MARELVVIDEADPIKTTGPEELRDFFDRSDLGLILIGMPGLHRRTWASWQLRRRIAISAAASLSLNPPIGGLGERVGT